MPLLVILLISKQLLWSFLIPVWHFPDEQAHFAQVQNLAEVPGKKISHNATTSQEIYESERLLQTLRDEIGNNSFTYHPEFNIPYTNTTEGQFETRIKSLSREYRHDRVINESTGYPGLYYQASAVFYRLVYQGDLFTRIIFTRLFNFILFLMMIWISQKIGKIVFPENSLMQLTYILLIGFQPMFAFVSAGINSDNLYNLLFTVGIYLSLKLITQEINLPTLVLSLVTYILLLQTKPQAKFLLLIYAFPLALAFLKLVKRNIKLAILILVLLAGVSYKYVNNIYHQQLGPDLLPLKDLTGIASISGFVGYFKSTMIETYRKLLPWYWGIFRWLSLTFPRPIHRVINWTILLSLLGLVKYLFQKIRNQSSPPQLKVVIFLIYASISYFLALTVYDYLFYLPRGFSFGLQGRYFFPLLSTHMALLLLGINELIKDTRFYNRMIKLLGSGMILIQTYVLFFVSSSYFGYHLPSFFLRASQYKPGFAKSPFLEILTIIFFVSLLGFVKYYFSGAETYKKIKL